MVSSEKWGFRASAKEVAHETKTALRRLCEAYDRCDVGVFFILSDRGQWGTGAGGYSAFAHCPAQNSRGRRSRRRLAYAAPRPSHSARASMSFAAIGWSDLGF